MAIDYTRLTQDASVVEILETVSKLKNKKEKISLLQKYEQRADFMAILRGAYANNIEWLVPDGDLPPGTSFGSFASIDTADDRLIRVYRQFQYLVKGGPMMKQSKREDIYLNLIRSLHIDEAKLLMSIVSKKLPYKGITKAIVAEAFPVIWPKEEKKTA
ncbi:hypothetical protein N9159_00400 [bacterium]|nr:hypothetical protein [bacterium]|tara:strand:+ start:28 stop:504 length:477 start_codon:yes stop_codon:yes gene_type:complete